MDLQATSYEVLLPALPPHTPQRDALAASDDAWETMRAQVAVLQQEAVSTTERHDAETARLTAEHAQQADRFVESLEAGRVEVERLGQAHEEALAELSASHDGRLADLAHAHRQDLAIRGGDHESALSAAHEAYEERVARMIRASQMMVAAHTQQLGERDTLIAEKEHRLHSLETSLTEARGAQVQADGEVARLAESNAEYKARAVELEPQRFGLEQEKEAVAKRLTLLAAAVEEQKEAVVVSETGQAALRGELEDAQSQVGRRTGGGGRGGGRGGG